jgi:hypothetical protein
MGGRAFRRREAGGEQRADTRGVRRFRAGLYYPEPEVVMQELRRSAEQFRAEALPSEPRSQRAADLAGVQVSVDIPDEAPPRRIERDEDVLAWHVPRGEPRSWRLAQQ